MSDCSTKAMLPKEQTRICESCSELYLAPKCNRLGWIDFDENDNPDDDGETYADHCIYWKRTDDYTIEQLARKAIEGYREAASLLKTIYDDGYVGIAKGANVYVEDAEEISASLEALGVKVDD